MDGIQVQGLQTLLMQRLGFITDSPMLIKKLSGGAIQENWEISSQRNHADYDIVLRKNAETSVDASSDRKQEYDLLHRLCVYARSTGDCASAVAGIEFRL